MDRNYVVGQKADHVEIITVLNDYNLIIKRFFGRGEKESVDRGLIYEHNYDGSGNKNPLPCKRSPPAGDN